MQNVFLVQTLATICSGKTATLSRKELDLLAKETGMVHPAAWGGWKIAYERIAPGVYSVRLGERFEAT